MQPHIGARILRGIVLTLIYPFRVIDEISERHDAEIRRGLRRRRGFRPDRLPRARRRRALSIPRKSGSKKKSTLLSVLPLEVRYLILQYCLAGNQYHLRIVKERLRGVRCASMNPQLCDGPGTTRGCQSGQQIAAVQDGFNCVSILQTCRAMLAAIQTIFFG